MTHGTAHRLDQIRNTMNTVRWLDDDFMVYPTKGTNWNDVPGVYPVRRLSKSPRAGLVGGRPPTSGRPGRLSGASRLPTGTPRKGSGSTAGPCADAALPSN